MRRFNNPALERLAILAAAIGATMLASTRSAPAAGEPKAERDETKAPQETTVKELAADEENPPVRDPAKVGVQGPESGPTGHTIVDATSPAPAAGSIALPGAVDPKLAKLREQAEKAAGNEKSARTLRVTATRRGYIGMKIREEGETFLLQLDEGEKMPSWVRVEPDENVATTPLSHSSEAQPEVVGADGIGAKLSSNDVL